MRSGNNIHVQQQLTDMVDEKWNKTQNDTPFVAFYDMHAEMAAVSTAGTENQE